MKAAIARLSRRYIRSRLAKSTLEELAQLSERRLLQCFQRAARQSPAYGRLLLEAGARPREIANVHDFVERCPILEKSTTFHRFPLKELIARDVRTRDVATILTSSGAGGSGFALGLGTRAQALRGRWSVDIGLDLAFETDRRRTLVINCLPMGVTFQSNVACVANVSVREDMACAIVDQAGDLFDQIILCGDPLFLKRLCDFSEAHGTDWGRYRLNAILGEETFPESFRDYLAETLRVNVDARDGGLIGSSMGVGELGLNLFHETRETVALRRACRRDPRILEQLLGRAGDSLPLPTFLAYNPLGTFVEVIAPDTHARGDLVVTVLDRVAPVPLMRYRTGDSAQFVDAAEVAGILGGGNASSKTSAFPMIALHGRTKDRLPSGWHVDEFKDALYRRREVARQLSGAFRLSYEEGALRWDVQLARDGVADPAEMSTRLRDALSSPADRALPTVVSHSYDRFPYGQTLDYERKFGYWRG
jgi:phenylacetate-CoA ligase